MAAAMALYKLGKDVEPAIPALTRMLDDRSAPNTARRAADVLANINTPETTAPIMRLLTNGGHPHQWIAVLNLQTMGTNAALGIPLLVECLSKTNRFLAEAAAISLGELKMEPAGVVPALTKALQHPDAYTRARVARALGCFQAQARPALPALLNALNDTNPAVRKEVADALKRIEKRTPTNAPAPAP
jgi:HEAT repeat protein